MQEATCMPSQQEHEQVTCDGQKHHEDVKD